MPETVDLEKPRFDPHGRIFAAAALIGAVPGILIGDKLTENPDQSEYNKLDAQIGKVNSVVENLDFASSSLKERGEIKDVTAISFFDSELAAQKQKLDKITTEQKSLNYNPDSLGNDLLFIAVTAGIIFTFAAVVKTVGRGIHGYRNRNYDGKSETPVDTNPLT